MDTEQQIRLNFLDEAEEYFDRMESNLLGLANTVLNPQQVDIVLRAAHSIKGGAAMMDFNILSQVAHRLEDFLKILRVRYASSQITTEVETLLLQGVDCLRTLSELNRQGVEITDSYLSDLSQSIFEQLREHLGDLEATDEDALMAQDEDVDPALLLFEEGVDTVLDRFETQLKEIGIGELAQELATTAQELISFGKMANLEPFTQLCESIQQQAATLSNQEIELLTDRALKTWRRSHALVLRGRIEKLPSCLEDNNSVQEVEKEVEVDPVLSKRSTFDQDSSIAATIDLLEDSSLELSSLQSAFEQAETDPQLEADFDPLEDSSLELSSLQSAFEQAETDHPLETDFDPLEDSSLELSSLQSAFEQAESAPQLEADFDPLEDSSLELSSLQSAFEQAETDSQLETDFDPLEDSSLELSSLQSAFEQAESAPQLETDFDPLEDSSLELSSLQSAFDVDTSEETHTIIQLAQNEFPVSLSLGQKTPSVDKMVRVSTAQLKQFNNLFEQLILNRNTINLRLQQLQNVITLMSQRMSQMKRSNTQLKQWYDCASVEGFLSNKEQSLQNSVSSLTSKRDLAEGKAINGFSRTEARSDRFDTLEMDRYSDVHLICQEQIETIVQLQEVTKDIELGLQEINQAVRDLNYTTKSMQGNVTRTQMLPLAEVVKRFPRVIRDLNLQFNKQVNLKIIGENTLLEQSVIEALSDSLMHLLRNAFDHGIEDSETRIAAGKPPSGTITIEAKNQGTYTVITLRDDGGGISLDKIRDRLVKIGIPQSDVVQIPEAELLDFIFEPGFSTTEQVTELSGRGVGMDVVRTNLQEIRGDVRVATKPGKGTTFTLRIPFTLSILRVAVIEQAGTIFAIPANSIRELVPLKSELIKTSENTKNLLWNQTEIPLVEIEKTLVYRRSHHNTTLTGNPVIDKTMAIVVGDEKLVAALQISHFWYEQESTIRPIDSPIPLPPRVISSVVLGDGKVIPLFDPILLIEECLTNHATNHQCNQNLTETKNLSTTKTILVVDDSINVRRYLSLTLEKAGYRVEQAKDGQEAVDKLLGGLSVQAVICDIEMPRLDGYGVLEEIKDRAEFAQLPIAMLTSRSNEKHRKLAINLGASAYFSKPYNEQELLEQLAQW